LLILIKWLSVSDRNNTVIKKQTNRFYVVVVPKIFRREKERVKEKTTFSPPFLVIAPI